MNTYLYENLTGNLISEETFEITVENVNRCGWCTVPGLIVNLQPTSVKS